MRKDPMCFNCKLFAIPYLESYRHLPIFVKEMPRYHRISLVNLSLYISKRFITCFEYYLFSQPETIVMIFLSSEIQIPN